MQRKLISRNPVQRFKEGKKIEKFQKAGSLPTAPKAENRYRYSLSTVKETPQEQITTIETKPTGYFRTPSTISQIVNKQNGDTTYVETPTHDFWVDTKSRKVKKSTLPYLNWFTRYYEHSGLGPFGRITTSIPSTNNQSENKSEFKILQNRFNTALGISRRKLGGVMLVSRNPVTRFKNRMKS